jgi:hypothetical protein
MTRVADDRTRLEADNLDAFKSLVGQDASPQVAQFLSGLRDIAGDYLTPPSDTPVRDYFSNLVRRAGSSAASIASDPLGSFQSAAMAPGRAVAAGLDWAGRNVAAPALQAQYDLMNRDYSQATPYERAAALAQMTSPYLAGYAPGGALSSGIRGGPPRPTNTIAGKGVQTANPDVAGSMIGAGTETPLFDLSRLSERPDVPQGPIERMPPPVRGIPDWWRRQIENTDTAEQYMRVFQRGMETAGRDNALGWWNTWPLRERTIGEFGEMGDPRWRSDMRGLSTSSPRTDFPQNIAQWTYFANRLAEGRGLPELYKKPQTKNPNAWNWAPVESAPPGFKNFPAHIQNIESTLDPATGLLTRPYPLSNPKPATMDTNLVGNWANPTIDVRDLRAMGATTRGGERMQSVDPASFYGYTEEAFHKPLAKEVGLDPAQMQSTTWVGVPEFFSGFDRSGTSSALGTLEDVIRQNVERYGLTPEQLFQRGWLRKEFPLRLRNEPQGE